MKKTVIEQYNGMHNKTVSRRYLEKLLSRAKRTKQKEVVSKIEKLLSDNEDKSFAITLTKKLPRKTKRRVTIKSISKPKKRVAAKKKIKLNVIGLGIPSICVKNYGDMRKEVPKTNVNSRSLHNHIPKEQVSNDNCLHFELQKKSSPILKKQPVIKRTVKGGTTMADIDNNNQITETFTLDSDLGRFLGDLEKKPVHSIVVTLDAPAGSGKTRLFFQLMNDYANHGKSCVFFTFEEHSSSKLFKNKRDQYIDPKNYNNITVVDEIKDYEEFKRIVENHEVILTDSFGKLQRLIKGLKIELDEHVRKAFDSKLFFFIFQRTTGKTMRGGSDSEFDGDVILEVVKPSDDYRENYVRARKNRYNEEPNIKYSVYHRSIIDDENGTERIQEPKDSVDSPTSLIVSSI
ncbi:hypothetical protein [Aquimarina spongiae]|uniref:Uncharacterized protein n=1 Tax=Aquimarina spongiae TaxID=570521 RepID=A0A1M6JFZ8_9FLAO|nr:hypothetical protein [Aquimarina spongiae]SHJ45623.1 hypothetical protein SAMN04488508_10947 [Aquimarina spongiae]